MARRIYPDDNAGFRPQRNGRPILSAAGAPVSVYLDAACTQVATDLLMLDGTPIVGGEFAMDPYSTLPWFQGPDPDPGMLVIVIDGGPPRVIHPRVDDRLDEHDEQLEDHAERLGTVETTLPNKADLVGGKVPDGQIPAGIARDTEVAAAVAALVNSAPGILDTLGELAAALQADESAATTLAALVAAKADLVGGTVPDAQLPAGIARDAEVVLLTQKGAANGVATLDSGGHLPDAQIPSTIARDSEVAAAVAALVNSAPGVLDTLGELAAALQADESAAAALSALVALKAPLASPALTGTPTVNGAPVETTTHAAGAYVPFAETVSTVAASGAALTLAELPTTIHDVTLTANCTLTFPTIGAGRSFTLRLTQDATGSRTVTWPASVRWSGDVAPVLTTTAAKKDILSFFSVGGVTWAGAVSHQAMSA